MASTLYSGIVHCPASSSDPQRLPLDEVNVQALIIDLSARVILTQTFHNPSNQPTSRAKYVFPVPASAAVCAFELRTSDGLVVTAVSKEKQVAAEEHEKAIRENKVTVLLEMVSDDLFTVSVGSIPGGQTVKTRLVYVTTLMNNDLADEIRFFLPMHVAERYGPMPDGLQGAQSTANLVAKLRVNVDIQTSGVIQTISSPTHDSHRGLIMEPYPTHLKRPSRRRYKVKYKSDSFLDRDFILLVQADGLDSPRCFAELRDDANGSRSLAMQLMVVPKAVLPPIPSQEYIFLLDRSGSMSGNSIETAKKTLLLLLRLLPAKGTFFNVFGFGSTVEHYWPKSNSYTQDAMQEMSDHITTIQANLGGTEIHQALDAVFHSRLKTVSTAVFVLTDGEVSDISGTMSLVQSAVAKSASSSPLRVFTLGIGEGVSTALCESIARAGNGVYFYAHDAESIVGKCARLLKAGRTPMVQNVTVDWGLPEAMLSSSSSVQFPDQASSSSVRLKPPPSIQQSPPRITTIHTGVRTDVYAIMSLKDKHVPQHVVLRGELDSDGSVFEHKVKIRGIELVDSDRGTPLIHTLAAWKLIQNHQEGVAPLPEAFDGALKEEDLRKAAIVRLGTTYQLASQFTSFVAVDTSLPSRGRSRFFSNRLRNGLYNHTGGTGSNRHRSDVDEESDGPTSVFPFPSIGARRTEQTNAQLPGGWPGSSSEESSAGEDQDGIPSDDSARTFTTLSSLVSGSDWSDFTESSDSETEDFDRNQGRSPSPAFGSSHGAQGMAGARGKTPVTRTPVVPTVVTDMIRLQTWDGSFRLDMDFRRLVGDAANPDPDLGVSNEIWATAVAVAFMEKHLKDNHELLGDLMVKAMEFLLKEPNLGAIMKRAKDLVQ
ncbi:von Willebrand factor A domain-containing protein 5A [Stygiomarasmius scandens]|uniref:von Willebrand factor A domain-containing protein 5A n=1 Tax=Marasmiellus scandens TaxID=2682957 RepID=A0ABR1J9C7_9AGAR